MAIARLFLTVLRGIVLCGVSLTATHVWAFELTLTDTLVDQAANVVYNPTTGDVSVVSLDNPLQSMHIESASASLFPGISSFGCPIIPPGEPWSCHRKVAHFDFGGFETFDFRGPDDTYAVLPSNLSADWIISDIRADGSRLAGGKINVSPGGGPYLLIVPEPSSHLFACLGIIGAPAWRQRFLSRRK